MSKPRAIAFDRMEDRQLFRWLDRFIASMDPNDPLWRPEQRVKYVLQARDALFELRKRFAQLPLFAPEAESYSEHREPVA